LVYEIKWRFEPAPTVLDLHLLEFGILVAIFNPGNDTIELRDLDLLWYHLFWLHTRDI
jgi:hypothetical protein